jgi:hypothetical protein
VTEIRDHRESTQLKRVDGRLPIKPGTYLQVTAPRHGPATLRPAVAALLPTKAKVAQPSLGTGVAASAAPALQVAGTGNLPAGFGRQVTWVGEDDFAMVAFVNTADDLGLCVSGVRDGDIYQHVAVAGKASFATDTRNNGIAGLIGVVGAGADLAAGYFGVPEVVPFINAAAKYAQQQFPESQEPAKRRDGYGEDDNHNKERAEGGMAVYCPGYKGIGFSGEDSKYWIKKDGTRDDKHLPDHLKPGDAFFLQRTMGPRRLNGTGDLFLCAWDWNFPDNAGFYEVHFILKRGR